MRGDAYKLVGFSLGRTALFALAIGAVLGVFLGVVILILGFAGSTLLGGESSSLLSQGAIMLGLISGGSLFVVLFFLIMIFAVLYNIIAELGAGLRFNLEDETAGDIKPISL